MKKIFLITCMLLCAALNGWGQEENGTQEIPTITFYEDGNRTTHLTFAADEVDVEKYVTVTGADDRWEIDFDKEKYKWLSITKDKEDMYKIIIKMTMRNSSGSRTVTVFVKDGNGKKSPLNITQDYRQISFNTNYPTKLMFNSKKDSIVLPLTSDANWSCDYENPDDKKWVTIEPDNGNSGHNKPIVVSVKENINTGTRKATIIFRTNNKEKQHTLIVTQIAKDIIMANNELTYDGNNKDLITPSGDTEGCIVTYSLASDEEYTNNIPTAKDAGTHTVYYKVIYQGDTIDVDSIPVLINTMEVSLTWDNTTFTYDGNPHKPTATVTNRVVGDECDVITEVTAQDGSSLTEAVNAGSYIVKATKLSNNNYTLPTSEESLKRDFTIKKATMSDITADPYSTTYDGESHDISVENVPTDATVTYGEKPGTYDQNVSPTQKNVGEKTVYYKVTKDNFEDFTGSATITVKPKEVSLTWDNTTFTYDGKPHKPTATVDNRVVGDECDVITEVTAQDGSSLTEAVNAGSYTVMATELSNNNYMMPTSEESLKQDFTINKKVLKADVTAKNKTYDGNVDAEVSATVETGIEGETLNITGLTGKFNTPDVDVDKTVTINSDNVNVTAGKNTIMKNYEVSYPKTTKATIIGVKDLKWKENFNNKLEDKENSSNDLSIGIRAGNKLILPKKLMKPTMNFADNEWTFNWKLDNINLFEDEVTIPETARECDMCLSCEAVNNKQNYRLEIFKKKMTVYPKPDVSNIRFEQKGNGTSGTYIIGQPANGDSLKIGVYNNTNKSVDTTLNVTMNNGWFRLENPKNATNLCIYVEHYYDKVKITSDIRMVTIGNSSCQPVTWDGSTYESTYTANTTADITRSEDETTEVESVDGSLNSGVSEVYTINGAKTATMTRGLNIIRMEDGTVRKVFKK